MTPSGARRLGWLPAALALWLQLLLPGATALAMAPLSMDQVAVLCHGGAADDRAPPPVHKLCPLCPLCGAAHAFVPAEPPRLPLPRAPLRLAPGLPRTASPGAAEPPVPRARAPPPVATNVPRPA